MVANTGSCGITGGGTNGLQKLAIGTVQLGEACEHGPESRHTCHSPRALHACLSWHMDRWCII